MQATVKQSVRPTQKYTEYGLYGKVESYNIWDWGRFLSLYVNKGGQFQNFHTILYKPYWVGESCESGVGKDSAECNREN